MDIIELFNGISSAINQFKAGDVVGVSTALVALVRAYRLVPGAPWPAEGKGWIVQLVLFWVGYIAAALTGALGFHAGWGEALVGAIAVGVNASGIHALTKAVGQATLAPVADQGNIPWYKKVLSVFVPAPKA